MTYYNHVYVIAFDVKSRKKDASDVTGVMLRAALHKRATFTTTESLLNECDGPYETETDPSTPNKESDPTDAV